MSDEDASANRGDAVRELLDPSCAALRQGAPVESRVVLLEREYELAELADALDAAHDGRGRFVLIEAPAGIGKTSLLRAATQAAAELGVTCLRARASDLERDFAYGCVRQLLEPTVARADEATRARLFAGAAHLAQPLFAAASVAIPMPADGTFSVLHGLYWLLTNIAAETPIVLVVDDLHWSDAESLRLLAYLAPRLAGLRLTVLTSTRTGAGHTPGLARLAASPETMVLRPRPLSNSATADLCRQRLGADVSAEFAAGCWEATGGNPFFLEALLHDASEQQFPVDAAGANRVRTVGPAAVAHAVLLRLLDAPAEATALVRAVAVLGGGASLGEAAMLAGVTDPSAARAADLLVRLAIFEPGNRLDFAHAIVREAVYDDLGARERATMHACAAHVLAELGSADERVAAQVAAADPASDPARVELLRRVAEDALGRGAPAAATTWLARALTEPPPDNERGAVLLALGTAQLRVSHPDAARNLGKAVELIREPAQLTTAVRLLANALTASGDADRSVDVLETAIPAVGPDDQLLLEADLAAHAQQARIERRAPAARRLERYAKLSGATPAERLMLATLAFERARSSSSAAEAAGHIDAALADGRLVDEQELDVSGTFYMLILEALAADRLDLAHSCLERALANATERASIPAIAFATLHRARLWMRRGDIAAVHEDAQTALRLLTAHDINLGMASASALLVRSSIETGDLDAAAQALQAAGFDHHLPAGLALNDLLEARGLLRIAEGHTQAGLVDLVEFGQRDETLGAANPLASRWRSSTAPALAALGDVDDARRMAAEELDRARHWHALALVDDERRLDHLRVAVKALEPSPARLDHARALTDLGAALRRANRRVDARAVLLQGLAMSERCSATVLAERARLELRAAGGRATDENSPGQLTTTERRVAELAVAGHSNPEIAQALFVTRKTVETHLGHVYRKLEITSRHELAAALSGNT